MKIFLSYHRQDTTFARQLIREFKKFGILLKTINLLRLLGNDVFDKLDEMIPGLDFVIVILSQAYIDNEWLNKELTAFFLKESLAKGKIIVPVMVEKCKVPDILGSERKVFDFRNVTQEKLNELTRFFLEKRQAFVVMKQNDSELDSAYEGVIKTVVEKYNYKVTRIDDDVEDSGVITQQILSQIAKSEIVIADLTGERPNCYYEAGYAHALGKEIIFTVKEGENIHFDLRGNRFIFWKTEDQLRRALEKRLESIQKRLLST